MGLICICGLHETKQFWTIFHAAVLQGLPWNIHLNGGLLVIDDGANHSSIQLNAILGETQVDFDQIEEGIER